MAPSTTNKAIERCGHCIKPVASLNTTLMCSSCKKYYHTQCIGQSVPEIGTEGDRINAIIKFAKKAKILFIQCKSCQLQKRPILQTVVPIAQPQVATDNLEKELTKKYKALCGTFTELQALQKENADLRANFTRELALRDNRLKDIESRLHQQNIQYESLCATQAISNR